MYEYTHKYTHIIALCIFVCSYPFHHSSLLKGEPLSPFSLFRETGCTKMDKVCAQEQAGSGCAQQLACSRNKLLSPQQSSGKNTGTGKVKTRW